MGGKAALVPSMCLGQKNQFQGNMSRSEKETGKGSPGLLVFVAMAFRFQTVKHNSQVR